MIQQKEKCGAEKDGRRSCASRTPHSHSAEGATDWRRRRHMQTRLERERARGWFLASQVPAYMYDVPPPGSRADCEARGGARDFPGLMRAGVFAVPVAADMLAGCTVECYRLHRIGRQVPAQEGSVRERASAAGRGRDACIANRPVPASHVCAVSPGQPCRDVAISLCASTTPPSHCHDPQQPHRQRPLPPAAHSGACNSSSREPGELRLHVCPTLPTCLMTCVSLRTGRIFCTAFRPCLACSQTSRSPIWSMSWALFASAQSLASCQAKAMDNFSCEVFHRRQQRTSLHERTARHGSHPFLYRRPGGTRASNTRGARLASS